MNQLTRTYVGPILAMFLWIGLSFLSSHIRNFTIRASEELRSTDRLIQLHAKSFGEVPQSLTMLKFYAKSRGVKFHGFDPWGQRIEYMRLGKVNYLLRSFGEDGHQNLPGDALDPGVFRWGPMTPNGLTYSEVDGAMHHRPSVVLFAGADDGSGKWHARAFSDQATGVSRLLVRSREQKNLYMLAPHDGVEEFLWIPHEEKIVFSATGSSRYDDGVYVWDLRTDDTANLLNYVSTDSQINIKKSGDRWWLGLSGVKRNTSGSTISFFGMRRVGAWLDPRQFFQSKNLQVFEYGAGIKYFAPITPQVTPKDSMYDTEFLGAATVNRGGIGTPLQKAWLRLPMGGDWAKGVMEWQEFASQHGKSVLAPYAVWGLAEFYRDAAVRAGIGTRNSEIFYGYSVELGKALSVMPVSPSYVRAIGAWMMAQQ